MVIRHVTALQYPGKSGTAELNYTTDATSSYSAPLGLSATPLRLDNYAAVFGSKFETIHAGQSWLYDQLGHITVI